MQKKSACHVLQCVSSLPHDTDTSEGLMLLSQESTQLARLSPCCLGIRAKLNTVCCTRWTGEILLKHTVHHPAKT